MDITSFALPGLVALGVVNVLTMWKPGLPSWVKFGASALVAFIVLFIPADLGNMLADRIKTALEVAFAASGGYKIAQVVGSKNE
jgi:hypothetical protein